MATLDESTEGVEIERCCITKCINAAAVWCVFHTRDNDGEEVTHGVPLCCEHAAQSVHEIIEQLHTFPDWVKEYEINNALLHALHRAEKKPRKIHGQHERARRELAAKENARRRTQ